MAKYEVITIAVAVKNNIIAKFGETVDDSELTVNGNALVEAGSLKLIEADTVEVKKSSKKEVEVVSKEVVTDEVVTEKLETENEEVVKTKKALTAAEKAAQK